MLLIFVKLRNNSHSQLWRHLLSQSSDLINFFFSFCRLSAGLPSSLHHWTSHLYIYILYDNYNLEKNGRVGKEGSSTLIAPFAVTLLLHTIVDWKKCHGRCSKLPSNHEHWCSIVKQLCKIKIKTKILHVLMCIQKLHSESCIHVLIKSHSK